MRVGTGVAGATGVLGDLLRYDPGRDEWGELGRASLLGEDPSPRSDHGMVAAAGRFYVFGGAKDAGTKPLLSSGNERFGFISVFPW